MTSLTIGKVIRGLRAERGLSQEKLGEHLGIAPQSVSKWERGEGYPDITFLIPLAEFFDVSLDVLMGRDEERTEMKIRDILSRLDHFRHMGDHEAKNKLAKEAYRDHPFDCRIIMWYITALFDVEDIRPNKDEIQALCEYVLKVCTEEKYRYEAITNLAELFSQCGEYDRAIDYANMLPTLYYCREYTSCAVYPNGDERDFQAMAAFTEHSMELLLWVICRTACHRASLTPTERICILEQACTAANALYPDRDFGICHSTLVDIHLALFRLYSEEKRTEKALHILKEAFRLSKADDDIYYEVITYTSPLLRGYTHDMKDMWSGTKCNAVWWLLERLEDPHNRFEMYDNDAEYQSLLAEYRPYAVEDMTRGNG